MARFRARQLAEIDVATWGPRAAPPLVVQLVFGLACAGVFLVARTFVDQLAPATGPFALLYPVVLIATLFGRWQAGAVAYVTTLLWTWEVVLPRAALLHPGRPPNGPPTIVNGLTLLIVLLFAEVFRRAVRRAVAQRDRALDEMSEREAQLRELNRTLETQVAERTRELSQTWSVSPDLLGVLNREGFLEASNPAWRMTLGLSEQTLRAARFLGFVHPDDIAGTKAAWADVVRGEPVMRFENRFRRADGGWCWLSWIVVPEGDKYYCSARDISVEKEQAAALDAAQEALRQSQKLEAIGQLTGGVAHDFNNLLTVIKGSVELLRRPNIDVAKRDRYIAAIGDTADRAARLTGQLLAFARRQALKPEVFDLGQSAEDIGTIVRTLVGSRIEVDLHAPPASVFVRADRSQFDTAIVNMAVNARDAMRGEGRLTIAIAPVSGIPAIRSHPPVAGEFVAITVGDTGAGIAPAQVDQIFEPFFTTKDVGQGTGLGLSQVFGFAKQSDGDIRVESVPGEGAIFTLYLPRVHPGGQAARGAPIESNVDGDGKCVLVVEDNPAVADFATAALKELGYDSVMAADAEQALAHLATTCDRFHAVFSDVVMPGMGGVEMGERIRQLYPHVPVILTSGYSHVLARNDQHGFELLHKPYSIEQLSRVLRRAMARQAGERTSSPA